MAYVLDAVVVLILAGSIFWGYRRGFVKNAAQTIGCVAAIVIAFFLSGVIAGSVFDLVIDKPLKTYANEQLIGTAEGQLEAQLDLVLNDMPDWTQGVLERMGYKTSQDIIEKLNPDADATVSEVIDDMVRPPIVGILRLIVFLVLFLLLMLVVLFMSKVLRRIFRFPLLRQLDGMLGIIPGVISGLLWIMGLTTLLQLYVSLTADTGWITGEMLRSTTLVRIVIDWNPLTSTAQALFV